MIALTSTNEINKIIRQTIITQSELQPDDVVNALSLYGVDLEEELTNKIFSPLDNTQAMILFELMSDTSNDNVSFTNYDSNDDEIIYDKAFIVKLIIYGDDSSDIASKLIARLRTEKIRNILHNEGIHIREVSDATIITEFKNNAMWLRNDIDISISCEFKINQLTDDAKIDSISSLAVIKNK